MDWRRSVIYALFPTARIHPKWRDAWIQKERRAYLISARIMHALAALVYLAHLILIDPVYRVEPRSNWIALRSVGIFVNVAALWMTYIPSFGRFPYPRLPLIVVGLVCTYLQALVMNWYSAAPYIYAAIVPSIAAICLRTSVLNSVLFMLACYALEMHAWFNRPHELADILSACSVALIFVGAIRARLSSDIDAFVSEEERLEAQKKIIQAEIALNEQIRAFLPKEIYGRFVRLVRNNRLPPLQAMSEVLQCRKATVTCLYTDIRGFTQKTKNISTFVENAAVPNIRACTDIVERYSGIPKLIGDLIFAYFDGEPKIEFLRALLCAFSLTRKNQELNQGLPERHRVNRFVLLSHGEALVGNVGGTDSSRDINALGTPANILSRIDPLTKENTLRNLLHEDSVILTLSAVDYLLTLVPKIECREIHLKELGLKIRDFEEQELLGVLEPSARNAELIESRLSSLEREIELTAKGASAPELRQEVVNQ